MWPRDTSQAERLTRSGLLGFIIGSVPGAIISAHWPALWGMRPILVGGLVGGVVAAIGRDRLPFAAWLVARYRYFEIALGTWTLLLMLFAVGVLVIRGPFRGHLDLSVIAILAIFLILSVTMVLGGGTRGTTSWMISTALIGLIAGLVFFFAKDLRPMPRAAWGFVALVEVSGAWAGSRKRKQISSD